ncbi:hypothetical protein JYT87_00630 [Nitrospira defluvii]|nr:hypothetical protein [Nitrospira defluvii]
MSLKDKYLKLTKKFGGPYSLVSKGISRGAINTIMRGGIPGADHVDKMADLLKTTVKGLLEGQKIAVAPTRVAEEPTGYGSPPLSDRQTKLLALDEKADSETRRYVRYIYQRAQPRVSKRRAKNKPVLVERRSGIERRKTD